MAHPLYVPRINNNDDSVRLTGHLTVVGARVQKGDPVADIETDKATFVVEAEQDGYILALHGQAGDNLQVGSILAWIGERAEETIPAETAAGDGAKKRTAEPTLKAALMLAEAGLDASSIPASGERLTAEDVRSYLAALPRKADSKPASNRASSDEPRPVRSGKPVSLSSEERGMLRTVLWHRDEAAPGYVELQYEAASFENYAAEFQQKHKLLLSPLLALHAWRLAQAGLRNPKLNSTIVAGQRYEYDQVNLGFTVQSGDTLFMVVLENAAELTEKEFVDRLFELQRSAIKRTLKANQSSGSTLSFTSMARWKVARHMPLLPPQTALIVAHSSPVEGVAFVGATYDHRVLSGYDAIQALQAVTKISNEN
ncbi:MAG: 2-oxo acid dehydrogenase subunit E2 [Acidobacteriaceae bacterium]|nr:2-oxo acid dehydrogenase subunit E2 [Acidobacteriaceae bacterium]